MSKAKAKSKESYVHVGDVLRDALVEDIDAIAWSADARPLADKVKGSLQLGAPHRGGYLVDTSNWSQADFDFLGMEIDSLYEDEGHSSMSRGVPFGNTRIGRQVRALRDEL